MSNDPLAIRQQRGLPAGPMFSQANPFFGLLPKEYRSRQKDFFTYNIRFNTLAANGTSTVTASVQNDSDFVWVIGVMTVTAADFTTFTAAANVPVLAELTDSASGVQLQDSQTHISNLFGTSQLPFTLPFPKIFKAGGQISARLQNQSATALVVNLAFHGFKAYFMQAKA